MSGRTSLAVSLVVLLSPAALVAQATEAGGGGGGGGPAPGSVDLAITNVEVLEVETGRRLPDRTVRIDEGRIVSIARSPARPDARRILDGSGGLLVPGFVDAHSHLGYVLGDSTSAGGGPITRLSSHPDSLEAYRRRYADTYLPYGVTTVRDVGSAEEDLPLLLDWLTSPRPESPDVFPSGGALVSHEPGRDVYPGHRVVRDSASAVAAVRGLHEKGIRHVKLYWRLREPEFDAALTEARRLGMHPTGHVDFHVMDVDRALDLGLRSFEHAYTLGVSALSPADFRAVWRERLPRWIGERQAGRFYLGAMEYFATLGPDDPRMAALVERLAETESSLVPTLHLFAQRFGLAPFEAPPRGRFDDLSGLTDAQLSHARAGYEVLADYVRRLHEAGVVLATGSDWADPGKAVLSEMWLLHEAGIPMVDVLRIGTLGGAEVLGITDVAGLVREGRQANLVLLSGNPLDDPGALLGPRTVIKDGKVVIEDGPAVGPESIASRASGTEALPALAVLVAVDQLGEDLLERYAPYLEGGLGRLIREGRWYRRATVDHAVTVSHPGHVTLSTGLDPASHGIVDAAFYEGEPGERQFVDAVADSSEHLVGRDGPGVSPRRIRAPGIWDWASGARARRVAIGTGRFSSLLYAGGAGHVYWFDRQAPGYVTSSYYRDQLPDWVQEFNAHELLARMGDADWRYTAPDSMRSLARRDGANYETRGLHPVFPHRYRDEVGAERHGDPLALAAWFSNTPMLDDATLALARRAVEAEGLGQDEETDRLVLVLSQIDNIGHWYGPHSLEQLDNLWRLDRALGSFLDFLDDEVGRGRYVLALSADHAAPPAPEHRRESGGDAVRVSGEDVEAAILAAVEGAGANVSPAARGLAMTRSLERIEWIADAMTYEELQAPGPEGEDGFVDLYRRSTAVDRIPRYPLFSFETGRSEVAEAGVAVRLQPEAMLDLDVSVHGSPYAYDRNVPVIFYGPGVAAGCDPTPAATRDVAPTLAAIAGFPSPMHVDGVELNVGAGTQPCDAR